MTMNKLRISLPLLAGLAACYSPNQPIVGTEGDGSDGSSGTAVSNTATSGMTSVATDDTTMTQGTVTQGTDVSDSVDTSAGSTDEGGPLCGNGMMDDGEMCDDGDDVDGNGCNNDCVESGLVLWEVDVSGGYVAESTFYGGNARVAADGDGAAYVSFQAHASEYFAVVRKLDPRGTFVWTVEAENPSPGLSVFPADIAATAQGAVALVGTIEDDSQVDENAFLNRYDAAGSIAWARVIDPGLQNSAASVSFDDEGAAILAGRVGPASAFASKYDANGTSVWSEEYQPNGGFSFFTGVRADLGGDVVICGGAGVGDGDVWVRRYTANAVEIWTETYAGVGATEESATAVAVTPDGGAVVVAIVDSNIWFRKYTVGGNVEWTQTHNGASDGLDEGFAVAALPNNDVVIAGREETAAGDFDAWTARVAAEDGAVLWSRTWDGGSGEDDGATGIAVTAGGEVVVAATMGAAEPIVRLYRLTE